MTRREHRWRLSVPITAIALAASLTFPSAASADPPQNGLIAYNNGSAVNIGTDIFTVAPSGAGNTRLWDSGNAQYAQRPSWSPDGTQFVFELNHAEVWLADADGTNRVLIGPGVEPDWSPDGTRIAFARTVSGNKDIYTMDLDGTNVTQLTTGVAADKQPSWSPDGAQIAYASGSQLWKMDADGSDEVIILSFGAEPDWSPDGTRIAYQANHVYRVDVDGTNVVKLTSNGVSGAFNDTASMPAWSPDGTRIAIFTEGTGPLAVGTIDPTDGSDYEEVVLISSNSFVQGGNPAWQPAVGSGALSVTLTDIEDPVLVGDPVIYQATVHNPGGASLDDVALEVELPASTTFDSVTPDTGSCAGTDPVSCDLGDLAGGASVDVEVVVTSTTAGDVSASAFASAGPAFAEDTETTTISPLTADLHVEITSAPATTVVGVDYVYLATVTNEGPQEATGLVLGNSDFVTAPGADCSGNVCTLATLAASASIEVTTTTQYFWAGPDIATYNVSSDVLDPDSSDNSAYAELEVLPNAAGCTVLGTEADDSLNGTDGADVMCGLGGDDTFDGGLGPDTVIGGAGSDSLTGGSGRDTLLGGSQADTLDGRDGKPKDVLDGGAAADECRRDRGDIAKRC